MLESNCSKFASRKFLLERTVFYFEFSLDCILYIKKLIFERRFSKLVRLNATERNAEVSKGAKFLIARRV